MPLASSTLASEKGGGEAIQTYTSCTVACFAERERKLGLIESERMSLTIFLRYDRMRAVFPFIASPPVLSPQ